MDIKNFTQDEIIDFLELHNIPCALGYYIKIEGSDFSLLSLPLSELEFDFLMNDFFIKFDVDSKNYNYSRHFHDDVKPFGLTTFLATFRKRTRVIPITVEILHTAALKGYWPVFTNN
ncbi:hypothetical protein ASE99_20855 [Serratia sp. Leaf51]|nr:hypothetical protein ASE99_20855 [Serratia sp. Leaf51]